MNRNNTPWQAAEQAELEWRDDNTPYSTVFEDIYFSREDGPAESRHVFLAGNHFSHAGATMIETCLLSPRPGLAPG